MSGSNLNVGVAADTRQLEQGMARAKAVVGDFAQEASRVGGGLNQASTAAQAATSSLAGTSSAAAGVAQQFNAIGTEILSGGFASLPTTAQAGAASMGGLQLAVLGVAGALGIAAAAAAKFIDYLYRVRTAKEAVAAVRITFNPGMDAGQVETLRKQLVEQSGISTEMSAAIASDFLRMQGVAVPTMNFLAAAIRPVAAAMSSEIPAAAREMAQAMDQPGQAGQRLLERLGASNDQLNRFHAAMGDNSALEARKVLMERINEVVQRQTQATGTAAKKEEEFRAANLAAARASSMGPNDQSAQTVIQQLERAAPATDRYAEAVAALTDVQRQAAGPSWIDVHETRLASLELKVKEQARAEGLTRDQARQRELTAQVEFWEKVLAGETLNAKQREDVTRRMLRAKEQLEDTQFVKPQRASTARAAQDDTQQLMQEMRLRAQITESDIQLRKAQLDEEVAAGRISQSQALADLAAFIAQKRTLQLQGMDDTIAQLGQETAAYRQAAADRVRVEQQTARQISQLRAEQVRESQRAAQEIARDMAQSFSSVESSFKSSLTGLLMGTTTLQRGMLSVGQAVVGGFVDMGFRMLSRWAALELAKTQISSAATQARVMQEQLAGNSGWGALLASWIGLEGGKTAATTAGVATRTAVTVAGTMTEKTAEKAAAMTSIGGDAAAAAAGAYKAVVGIPIIGPVLAPAAAAVAFAAVMAFGGMIPSFDAGTMNVPQDMTARIHKGEMIIPASIASAWRAGNDARGFAGGFGGGGGGGAPAVNLYLQAMDAASFMQRINEVTDHIARGVSRAWRNNPTLRPTH